MCCRTRARTAWKIVAGTGLVALAVATGPIRGAGRGFPAALAAEHQIFGVTKESAGPVTVALTPKRFENGRLVIDVALTTHTGDLGTYDLKKAVALRIDANVIPPSSAPGLEGHHGRGQLVFPLTKPPSSLTVEIRDLGRPEVRVLRWP